jgi:hypothetical protein
MAVEGSKVLAQLAEIQEAVYASQQAVFGDRSSRLKEQNSRSCPPP